LRPNRERFIVQQAAYFISTQTARRQPFFRHDRWAKLMEQTLLHYGERDYCLHAFVIMPDHVHVLLTPNLTIEKAFQLIKGGFSFRARKELAWKFEIWQQGFSDHRIRDEEDWQHHLDYIRQNPVRAGMVSEFNNYQYMGFPDPAFPPGLKPFNELGRMGMRTG
jgi:putative transposase